MSSQRLNIPNKTYLDISQSQEDSIDMGSGQRASLSPSWDNVYLTIDKAKKGSRSKRASFSSSISNASTSPMSSFSPPSSHSLQDIGKYKATKRRPHSKSRHGCTTCKRRRVKCDETHPICKNCQHLDLQCSYTSVPTPASQPAGTPNVMDIRLFHHFTTIVSRTIADAGIPSAEIWNTEIPNMAFDQPCLMSAILALSARHLAITSPTPMNSAITSHHDEAIRLLSQDVRSVTPQNFDALLASSILLILGSLANASLESSSTAWLHHVRGAAKLFTGLGAPTSESRFYNLVNVDLSDLAEPMDMELGPNVESHLECFDEELLGLYPVKYSSPYYRSLAYLEKLYRQRYKSDFILRVFSFPALLDRDLVDMLIQDDSWTKQIIRVYYKLVQSFTSEMKASVWFLEGIAKTLPTNADSEFGGLESESGGNAAPHSNAMVNPEFNSEDLSSYPNFAGSEALDALFDSTGIEPFWNVEDGNMTTSPDSITNDMFTIDHIHTPLYDNDFSYSMSMKQPSLTIGSDYRLL